MSKKIKFSKRKKPLSAAARRRPNISFEDLDCRNVEVLKKFVTEQGKILSRHYTGLPNHFQRRMAKAIKRARNVLLMR
jgi:small subunit ribosomal protein S18